MPATYAIVRLIPNLDRDGHTVACVYGPYDEQGAASAYKKLTAAGLGAGDATLQVRGLFPTSETSWLKD